MTIAFLKGLLLLTFIAIVLRPDKEHRKAEQVIRRRYRQSAARTQRPAFIMPHKKTSPWSKK